MPLAALAAALCLCIACGFRPARDWTELRRDLDIEEKELGPAEKWSGRGRLGRCQGFKLKKPLEKLGMRGKGDPCRWPGVECNLMCRARRIRPRSADGDIAALRRMTTLLELDLHNTSVRGDIKNLQNLTRLERLVLHRTDVRGDIENLQNLTGLKKLSLFNTGVRGDIQSLQNLKGLEHVVLHRTDLHGDIESLQNLKRLKELSLFTTDVRGDIESLHNLKGIKIMVLYHTNVRGDIKGLQNLTGLRELSLSNTDACGDIENLQKLTGLKKLFLHHTDVRGDIETLQNLTGLQLLFLFNTGVHGDIGSLQNLTGLQEVSLAYADVHGDIKTLQNRELKLLSLSETGVRGDIESLHSLTGLEKLVLHHTSVFGDIESLQNLAGLAKLVLYHTDVRGDVENLQNLTRLKELSLHNTYVRGDIESLRNLIGLEKLVLHRTDVRGDIENLQNLTGLKKLYLHSTGVCGDIENLQKLTGLQNLYLSNTSAQGDIDALLRFPSLEVARLRSTGITGWISPTWNGRCKKLRELQLAESQVGQLQPVARLPHFRNSNPLLPALQILNVSGCRLNGSVKDFLFPLANSPLTTIAASSAALTGEVPDLATLSARVDGVWYSPWLSRLSQTLQVLDLSWNSLMSLTAVPASLRVDLSKNRVILDVAPSALAAATTRKVEVWLEGTQMANSGQLRQLLPQELRLQNNYTRTSGGFACRELVEPWLRVTPELFMPAEMCACRPGYMGHATSCSPCPANTYSNEMNSPQCSSCPPNSKSSKASESWQACECSFGAISAADSALRCQCPASQALVAHHGSEHCVPCAKLHLQCPEPGSNATTADVIKGYARLRRKSSKVFKCLDSERCVPSGCGAGYTGTLCSDCLPGYRGAKKGCQKCTDVETISSRRIAFFGFCGAGVLALLAAAAWSIRRFVTFDLRCSCAVELIEPQLAVLLQLVQLWSVLGRLAQPLEDDFDLASNVTNTTMEAIAGDGFFSLEAFQLTTNELQNFLALQCIFEGAAVRLFFAIATPLTPLVLLLACCFLEIFLKGTGIQLALKILAVLFIGGAAGAAQLLSCQRVDGTGKRPLGDFAFRPLLLHLQCTDAKWVDWIGHACASCYGVVIPCFLALLFAKQHLTMRQCKTFSAHSNDKEEVTLQLQVLSAAETLKEDAKRKRLVAAAAAYVAVHLRGRIQVDLKKDSVTLKMIQHGDVVGNFEAAFSDHLVYEEPSLLRSRRKMIQHHAMAQMLMERTVLADIKSTRSDRIMLGASQLLCKYANCGFVWMEVCMKLASAALVSVVGSKDGFWLSGAILLGMALVVGIAQPFARPQVNALQTSCFACLALAALGFKENWRQLSYLALALPVLQLSLSLVRPDSSEALALRLHKELEEKLVEGPAEVSAEDVKFL